MPSSLTRVLPVAFGSSPCQPVSVSGTGTQVLARGFSRQCEPRDFGTHASLPFTAQAPVVRISLHNTLAAWTASSSRPLPCPPVSPLRSNGPRWYGILHPLPFAYALRPRLRSRLTLGGRTFPRNPSAFGGQDSHLSFVTYTGILTSRLSTRPCGRASPTRERSPTTVSCPRLRSRVSAPFHFRRSRTRPVSYYALFQ